MMRILTAISILFSGSDAITDTAELKKIVPHFQKHDALATFLSVKAAMSRVDSLPHIGTVASAPHTSFLPIAHCHNHEEEEALENERRELPERILLTDILEALRSAGAKGVFAISGKTYGQSILQIYSDEREQRNVSKTPVATIRSAKGLLISEADVHTLLQQAVQSGYGDLQKQETVIDHTVRNAMEIEHPRACLSGSISSVVATEFPLLQIRPDDQIIYRPLKLNIYRTGGHFAEHVDTPVTPNMIGTLIFHLPTEDGCTGGELEIMPPQGSSVTEPFVWRLTNTPSWVMFFGDCRHTVKPVTSGTRLTYTFAVLANSDDTEKEEEQEPEEDEGGDVCSDIYETDNSDTTPKQSLEEGDVRADMYGSDDVPSCDNLELVIRPTAEWTIPDSLHEWLNDEPLGIVLCHEYPFIENPNESVLKGIDRMLWDGIRRAFPRAILTNVVYDLNAECLDATEYYGQQIERSRSDNIYAFSPQLLNCLRRNETCPMPSYFSTICDNQRISFITLDDENNGHIVKEEHSRGGYTGNHVEPHESAATYCAMAILIPRQTSP